SRGRRRSVGGRPDAPRRPRWRASSTIGPVVPRGCQRHRAGNAGARCRHPRRRIDEPVPETGTRQSSGGDMRSSMRPIRGGAAAVMAAGAALALAAATPALAQDRDETRARGRSCYCVNTAPETFWTGTLSFGRARLGVYLSSEETDEGAKIERV